MSWTEQELNRVKCGICKYSLSPELEILASVREFPLLQHSISSLSCFEGNNYWH